MKEVEQDTKSVERSSDSGNKDNSAKNIYEELGWSRPPVSVDHGNNSPFGNRSVNSGSSAQGDLEHHVKSPWERAGGKNEPSIPSWMREVQGKNPGAQKDETPPKENLPKEQVPAKEPAKPGTDNYTPKVLPLPPFEIPGSRVDINRKDGPLPSIYKDHLPPFRVDDGKDRSGPGPRVESGPGKLYELRRLDNRAGDHASPDAMVRIPSDFDPSKPINLVVYNHGWRSTAQQAYNESGFEQQMRNAPPNSVLVVPEWQLTAGASNGVQGRFAEPNRFRGMLQEIFNKTPELKGKTLNDVASIDIFSHSAGYNATNTELYQNGLIDKVRNITMLDSNYDGTGVDSWIRHNINDLASGKKHFINIFNDTSSNSKDQADRVQKMLANAGLRTPVYRDYSHPNEMLDENTMANNPIIFKFSKVTIGGNGPHGSMPLMYLGPIEAVRRKGR